MAASSHHLNASPQTSMVNRRQERTPCTLTKLGDEIYKVGWIPLIPHNAMPKFKLTTLKRIQDEFPVLCEAIREAHHALNAAVPLQELQICVAVSFSETVMRSKRAQVYYHLACACGYAKRTEFPDTVVDAIRSTWHDANEQFVGFQA